MIALSLIAGIYVGLVAMVQKDMKKLVAYSSVAHMGFVTLGFFIFNDLGVSGGLVQMIAHGFVSGAMFLSIRVRSPAMVGWSTPCPSLQPLPCCLPWPIAACRVLTVLSVNGW